MLQTNIGSLHNALGQPRMVALTGAIHVTLLLPMLLFATFRFGLDGTAWAILAHMVVHALPITYWIVFRTTPIRIGDVIQVCWRPVVACAVMYGAVRGLLASMEPRPEFMQSLGALLAACALGVIIYVAAVLSLWMLAGRPQGAESSLIDRITSIWSRLATRDPPK